MICFDAVALRPHRVHAVEVARRLGGGRAKPGDRREIFRAGAMALFLAAAADQRRRHHQIGRGDDGAGALRAADLVRRQDQVIAVTI